MEHLTENEIFTLVWIRKKIKSDLIVYTLERDSSVKEAWKNAILDVIRNTNDENHGLLEAVFISHFQEDDFQWMDIFTSENFEIFLQRYLIKLDVFL